MTELSRLMGLRSGVTNSNAFYGLGFMTIINRDKGSMRVIDPPVYATFRPTHCFLAAIFQ